MTLANPAAENALATLGAILWSFQLVPQVIKSYKRKSTAGLSTVMLLIWILSASFLGAFLIIENLSIPLIIQPQLFAIFGSVCFGQCLYYEHQYSLARTIATSVGTGLLCGILEVGMVLVSRSTTSTVPATVFGIMAAVLVTGGLLPQYYEIWKYKAVIGISLVFLAVDLFGGVFSAVSLIFAPSFDTLASISYAAVVVLELGVLFLALILNPAHKRKLEAESLRRENVLADRTTTEESPVSEMKETSTPLGWMDEGVSEREAAAARV